MWIMLIYYLLNVPSQPAHDDVKKWMKLLGKLQHIHRSNQDWWRPYCAVFVGRLCSNRYDNISSQTVEMQADSERKKNNRIFRFLSSSLSCFYLPPAPVFLSVYSQFFPPCSRCLASVAVITHETPSSSICLHMYWSECIMMFFFSKQVCWHEPLKAPRSSLTP